MKNIVIGTAVLIGVVIIYGLSSDDGTSSSKSLNNDYSFHDDYQPTKTFNNYPCTDDCSGHEAGYEWAEDKGIYDESDCGGNSNSFIEGCISYVEDNY